MLQDLTNNTENREELSLLELNNRIKGLLSNAFAGTYWIRAEMSDVRSNASSGHCYLEFVEKNAITGQLVAKARASIWAKTFRRLKPYFEAETGQPFASGLKVLVQVSVEFHELYGFNLTVQAIDPAYTIGDRLKRRMEIIRQLQKEGVFTLNKELLFPELPVKIAVITSPTAAGYEDFMNQLIQNKAGYVFYPKLFPAIMQGEKTEPSIISALERIYNNLHCFDAVVIIRGGGSTSDLNSFDSYALAANCAQFPLPILTGIGHERDDTVLDLVAHTRLKTPTAVAEFLIGCIDMVAEELAVVQQSVASCALDILLAEKSLLQTLGSRLPLIARSRMEKSRAQLQHLGNKLPLAAAGLISKQNIRLSTIQSRIKQSVSNKLTEENRAVGFMEQYIKMASPDYILKRGYTLSLKEGKIIKRASELATGDKLISRFADGEVESQII